MAYSTVTITGTMKKPGGTPLRGTLSFVPNVDRVTDAAGNVVLAGTTTVKLDSTGSFSVSLPATDDVRLTPSGFQYHCYGPGDLDFTFSLPASPGTTTLAALVPVAPAPVAEANLTDATVKALVDNPASGTRSSLSATYAPRDEKQGVTAAGLSKWIKALRLSLLDQSPARVLCVGDSTTAGYSADSYTTTPGSANVGSRNAYPAQLADYLTAQGIPAYDAFVIPGHTGSDDARWPVGGWSYAGSGNGLGAGRNAGLYTATASAATTISPGVTFDSATIYYYGDTSTGAFDAVATNGTPVSVNTTQSTAGLYKSATITAQVASAENTIVLTQTSGTVYVVGVEVWDSTNPNRVRVMNAGVSSSSALDWAEGPNSTVLGGRALISKVAPDLTVISLGINDTTGGQTAGQILANVNTLVSDAQVSGSVLLASAVPHSNSTSLDAVNALFRDAGLPYVDFQWRYGQNMATWGLQITDNTHPNALGYGDMAAMIGNAISTANGSRGTDTGWKFFSSFSNGWSNLGSGFQRLRYRRIGQQVQVSGVVTGGTMNATIVTLPTGFRPTAGRVFPAISNNAIGSIQIDSTGVLKAPVGSNTWVSIEITFDRG